MEHAGKARSVLSEIRRPEAIPQPAPHFSSRRAIVVSVDGDRQRDRGIGYELTSEDARAAAAGKQDHVELPRAAGARLRTR